MSRTTNSLRNAGTAIAGQMLNNLMRFLCRTAFIHTLGQEYLGISSLYTNILTILNIGELGFSSAVTYSLYGPLAKDDRRTVLAVMAYLKKAYRIIGLAILGLGLMLMPALPHLMTGVTDKVDIYQYYLLYLAETVASYLFLSYRSVLLVADQRKYAVDLVRYGCQIGVNLLQIGVLFVWRSFLGYTLLALVGHIAANLITAVLAGRHYPGLARPAEKLEKEEKKAIFSRVYAAFLYKISGAVGTATDNLIISAMVSVAAVGLYNNYYLMVTIVQKLLGGIFQALSSSLGNLYATESRARNAAMFRNLNFVNNYLVCTCSLCFLVLFQPFVRLWAGEGYLLPFGTVVLLVLNFATNYLQNVVQIYCNASGVFVRGKYRAVANAGLNLVLSLVLVGRMGIGGVLLGSIVSRMLTRWWFDAWLLFRAGFGLSPGRYYADCAVTVGLTGLCWGAVRAMFSGVGSVGWPMLLLMGAVSVLLSTAVYFLLYGRTAEFAFLKKKVLEFRKRKT